MGFDLSLHIYMTYIYICHLLILTKVHHKYYVQKIKVFLNKLKEKVLKCNI